MNNKYPKCLKCKNLKYNIGCTRVFCSAGQWFDRDGTGQFSYSSRENMRSLREGKKAFKIGLTCEEFDGE